MLEREQREATRLAREAGRILLEVYATDFDVAFKERADPVTEADRRANTFLVDELRRLFPDDGIVAEESADQSDALRRGRVWYVDPLDGTKEFVARNGEFSVMLGLAIDGESTLGVVHQPEVDKLYRGVVGQGAFLEEKGAARELRVTDVSRPEDLRLVVSRSHRSKTTDEVVRRLGIRSEVPSGSVGLKIGMLAEQRADLYVHLSPHSSAWDACGPEAILRAAGGRFTDCAGDPFRYGGTELGNVRGILACNAAAFDRVAEVVRAVAKEHALI